MAVVLAALYFALPPDPPGGISSIASSWLGFDPGGMMSSVGGWLAIGLFVIVGWMLIRMPLQAGRRSE
jgi:hypothetical protein